MLSYRHGYHAGNPADLLKHSISLQMLSSLQLKEKGYCYLDTHAGAAWYDLSHDFAQKTKEHLAGAQHILSLNQSQISHPSLLAYQQLLIQFNQAMSETHSSDEDTSNNMEVPHSLRYYPGSPAIALIKQRQQDDTVLCELHNNEFKNLRHNTHRLKRMTSGRLAIHHRDAYEAMAALLPPEKKRALILIDPSYETREEVRHLQNSLRKALQRFSHGIYAIWYPVIEGVNPIATLRQQSWLQAFETQLYEIQIPSNARYGRMNATGMLIINPPWHAQQALQDIDVALTEILGSGH